jgi:hypothetical protein
VAVPAVQPTPDVYIHSLVYTTSDERIELRNRGTAAQDMTNWYIHSVVGDQFYIFPAGYTLGIDESVFVHSGPLAYSSPPTHLLWDLAFIWNDDGDKADLYAGGVGRKDSYCWGTGCP